MHIHTHTYIQIHTYTITHTYYRGQMFHSVLFNWGDGHPGIICRWHVHHPRYKSV